MKYGDSTWIKSRILEYEINKLVRNFEEEAKYKVEEIVILENEKRGFSSRIYIKEIKNND